MTSSPPRAPARMTQHDLPTLSTWLLDICTRYRGYPPKGAPGTLDLGWLLMSLSDDEDLVDQREPSLELMADWGYRGSALVIADRGPERPIDIAIWIRDVEKQRIIQVVGSLAVASDGAPLVLSTSGRTLLFSLNSLSNCPDGLRGEDAQTAMLRARYTLDYYLANGEAQ